MMRTLRWRGHARQGRQQGYTLMEMMVVIGILAILVGIAVPRYSDWRAANALQAASETLMAHLKQARIMAVSGNRTVYVQFAAGSYTIDSGGPDQHQYLLSSYAPNLTASTNIATNKLSFKSGGTASSCTVTLSNSNGTTRAITVNKVGRAYD